MTVDMSKVVIPKSDQLNADDLIAGPRTITVTRVTGNDSAEQPVSVFFEGDNGKPYKPGLSMRRVMLQVWGADASTYAGKSMTLFCDPEVKFGGMKVGGIRISHMSGIDKPVSMMLTTTRGKKSQYVVRPLADDPNDQALYLAQEAADEGVEAFTRFWNSDEGKKARKALRPHLDDLKARAKKADDNPDLARKIEGARAKKRAEKQIEEIREDIGDTTAPHESELHDEEAEAVRLVVNPESEEYRDGLDAAAIGFDGPCPYAAGSAEARDWQAGFDAAKKEKAE